MRSHRTGEALRLRGAALALFALGCIVGHLAGCASSAPKVPAYCSSEEEFTKALLACVSNATTKAESRACRKHVHERCGFVETVTRDGGMP